jgi:hypothetical protein
MTITPLQTAAAVGGTAGYPLLATKTTLGAGTTVIGISAQLTNGARGGDRNKTIKIYVAVTPFSTLTTTTGPQQLVKQAQVLEIVPSELPAGLRIEETGPIPALGDTCFVWVETPLLDAAGTLSINLIQL